MSETPNKPSLRVKGRLMSASEIERTLVRLAHEKKATAVRTWRWWESSAAASPWPSGWAS